MGALSATVSEEFERQLIERALASCDHVRSRAAAQLRMSERNLYKKIKKYNLD